MSDSAIKDRPVDAVAGERARGACVLIDVREGDEHAAAAIPGSANVPLSQFDPDRVAELAGQHRAILYCGTGNRSRQAAARLLESGWREAEHLDGGYAAWHADGQPVATASGRRVLPLDRQVQLTVGSAVLAASILGAALSPWWLLVSGGAGLGLAVAGATGFCGMAKVLAKMPWNRSG